ncbi:MAG: NAD-dependent epimerase/dehydratase family protein [Chloroflexi bacterium]|nr:NAD-dependent epimerase/dehydratase family protein [Chloroflexota bacterium]MCY4248005.1 NAD-dependent epimerase/dehydratase family protein [Chloroflexota bacterium]
MLALITGATGFLGSHVLRRWLAGSHAARVLYRSPSKLRLIDDLSFEAVAGDLDDAARLEAACAGCEVVFHIAAKADYWKDSDREALWRINVDGTRNVLAAAQKAGVARVVFTSSASAIGIRPSQELADEDTAFNLRPQQFYYAHTKRQAEAVVAEFVADGLDVVTLNPTVIIGPGDLNAISGSFVIETARWQWLVPSSSGGLAVIDVRDVARAHVAAVEKGHPGERYILNAANLNYSEFFRLIARACGVRPPLLNMPDWLLEPTARFIEGVRHFGISTPMDANQARLGSEHVYFDGGKAERELCAAQIDIETSLRETYEWYARNGYIRHSWLTRLIGWL